MLSIVQFSYMPSIANKMFFILLQSFTTTCFAPTGHPQAEHNINQLTNMLLMPQRIRCFVIV
jgi:hypothetical protein